MAGVIVLIVAGVVIALVVCVFVPLMDDGIWLLRWFAGRGFKRIGEYLCQRSHGWLDLN